MKVLPVSVVIATVGGCKLIDTLESLLESEFVPAEVIICLPPGVTIRAINSKKTLIKIINSKIKGQVKQRIFSYEHCSFEIVMQSDDDLHYGHLFLKKMYDKIVIMGPGNVIGPSLFDFLTKDTTAKYSIGWQGLFKNFYDTFICLAPWGRTKMGKISKIGLGYGVDFNFIKKFEYFKVSWLPGACSMSYKKNLILEDYYPFEGKAFGEDILHSINRARSGLNIYIIPNCDAYFLTRAATNLDSRSIMANIRAHRLILENINGNIFFFSAWAFIFFLKSHLIRIGAGN